MLVNTVFGVTGYLCVTCKFNKIMALDTIRTLDLFHRKNVIVMWDNFTSEYDEIYNYLYIL